jgi:DNA-binding NtrC family response regulator
MTLPEMHGLQTLQKIHALNTNVPVIVDTGETSEETRKQCERLGVHEYLSKPVDYDALLRVFRRALADEESQTEEYEVVTLRLTKRVIACLTRIDENIERAVTELCEERLKRG